MLKALAVSSSMKQLQVRQNYKSIRKQRGHNGFDELRRYIKGGGEFCKELAVILQERAELESAYAKGLHKLAGKLLKASRDSLGSVHQAWQAVGQELDNEAEVHRNVHEWRTAEYKAKKQSHSACRENEKIQDMALEARLGRGKTLSEKEAVKMEKQRRKAEELVQRSEVEFFLILLTIKIIIDLRCKATNSSDLIINLRDSASRLEEPVSQCDVEKDVAAIINAKGTGENIPHQLLPDFYAEDINNIMNRERRRESLEKLSKSFKGDIERERRGKQGVENLAKALQETPKFGSEDSQQDVNDKLQHMRAMLAYLEAARHKIECSLAELQQRPRPSHPVERHVHTSRDKQGMVISVLKRHVHTSRDKQGMVISVLKVPAWLTPDSASPDRTPPSDSPADSPDWRDRGAADGTSVQPDSDFDEFSSQGSDRDYQNAIHSPGSDIAHNNIVNQQSIKTECDQITNYDQNTETDKSNGLGTEDSEQTSENQNPIAAIGFYATQPPPADAVEAMGRCKALYDYDANMYDELTIRTGDIIQLHRKQPDGWWVGELDGNTGIFPATYVEEID
ncbi:nostrin [Hyalella azteca]|uniref:Nostrin n=1 Tax=Hyalella azteca TaxID=294128 RepID=A0A979FQF3_HYAAZ|nr:nostrin [Hyalella azteca]